MSEIDSHNTTSASKPASPNMKAVPLSSISTNNNSGAVPMPSVASLSSGQVPNQPAAAPATAPAGAAATAPSGPVAAPMPPAPTATAVMPPASADVAPAPAPVQPNLPVAVPGPDYHPVAGAVNPSGPQPKQPRKRNGLLVVGIIVCLLAAIALICALFYLMNRPNGANVDPPSTEVVEEAFEAANISAPTLSDYGYVNTDGLEEPDISNVQIGEVTQSGTGDSQKISCSTTAQATFQNNSVRVEQTLQMAFTYNTSSSKWEAGKPSVQSSGEKVTPTGPADIAALQEALPELLKAYDENIAAQYEGAEITAVSNLSETGGDITFTLDKTNEDGTHAHTNVNVGVVWDNSKGWVPTINWIGEAPNGEQAENANSDQNASTNENNDQNQNNGGNANQNPGNSDNNSDMLLTCSTGDLVEVPGVIEYRDDRVLLRSDYTIRVVLDGNVYITTYFELTANTFVVTNGAHVSVIGEISATGTLPQAPLMISLDYEG